MRGGLHHVALHEEHSPWWTIHDLRSPTRTRCGETFPHSAHWVKYLSTRIDEFDLLEDDNLNGYCDNCFDDYE